MRNLDTPVTIATDGLAAKDSTTRDHQGRFDVDASFERLPAARGATSQVRFDEREISESAERAFKMLPLDGSEPRRKPACNALPATLEWAYCVAQQVAGADKTCKRSLPTHRQ